MAGSYKPTTIVYGAAATLVVAAALVLCQDYRSSIQRHRAALVDRGETFAEALTAGMRAQGRMARARGERVGILFEEASKIPGVLALRLSRDDGTTVALSGTDPHRPFPGPGTMAWTPNALEMTVVTELSPIEDNHGGNAPPWQPSSTTASLSEGRYYISLALDASSVYEEVFYERLRLAVSLGAVACAALALAALIVSQMRRVTLEADLLRAKELAEENERLARLGAGLAHETKNPLNVVRGLAQDIALTPQVPHVAQEEALRIVDEVDRTVGHINGFLTLSRPKDADLAPLRLDVLAREVLALLEPEAREKGITLESDVHSETILADRDLLRRAVFNLLLNAVRACRSSCKVRLESTLRGSLVDVQVADNGCGISSEDLAHVKEPYFSRFEGGTGLGLPIVEQIARAHGVTLELMPRPEGGTYARLRGFQRATAS